MHAPFDGQAPEPERGNLVAAEPARHDARRSRIGKRGGRQRVVAKNAARLVDRAGDEGLGPAALVVLARVTREVLIERWLATVEGLAIVAPGERGLGPVDAPSRTGHREGSTAEGVEGRDTAVRLELFRRRIEAPLRTAVI